VAKTKITAANVINRFITNSPFVQTFIGVLVSLNGGMGGDNCQY
jgi:hypothetical protein